MITSQKSLHYPTLSPSNCRLMQGVFQEAATLAFDDPDLGFAPYLYPSAGLPAQYQATLIDGTCNQH